MHHSLTNMFPVCHCRGPGQQVFISFNAIGRFLQRIHNHTGLRTLDTTAEQPVLSAHYKRPNRILMQVVGDRRIAIVRERHQLLPLVQGIPYCILQLTALFRAVAFSAMQNTPPKGAKLHSGGNLYGFCRLCIHISSPGRTASCTTGIPPLSYLF